MEIDKGLIGGSTVLMLLALLEEKDCYGYEIIKELKERSDSTFEFKEGTLYPVLHRMEDSGLVKSYRKEAENGKTRKYYRMLGYVKFSYDHENIRQELQEHIEDMMDDLCGNGMSEAEAVSLAVINMGNPDDIGKELNKAHNSVLGFMWFISRQIVAVIIAMLLVEAVIVL